MALDLDRERIDTVVGAVADRLPGDWILIGGGLVSLWLDPRRVTEDVDLVGVPGSGAERLALLGLAQDLGLPVEALNSAADFFLYRIADWRQHLEPFRNGASGRIFRPSPTLFLLLKVGRLSGQDLADCLAMLDHCRAERRPIDAARIAAALDALPGAPDDSARERRQQLHAAVAAFGAA